MSGCERLPQLFDRLVEILDLAHDPFIDPVGEQQHFNAALLQKSQQIQEL